jgi:hypothetical protein
VGIHLHTRYWQWELKIHLLVKFEDNIFTEDELPLPDHDLREHIPSKLALFATLQKHLGIAFAMSVQEKFQEDPTLFEQKAPFYPEDLMINVHVTSLPYYQKDLQMLLADLEGRARNKWTKKLLQRERERTKEEHERESEKHKTTVKRSSSAEDISISGKGSPTRKGIRRKGKAEFTGEKGNERHATTEHKTFDAWRRAINEWETKEDTEFLIRMQHKRQKLVAAVFGDNSLEAAVGLFKVPSILVPIFRVLFPHQVAEAESRAENNTLALELVGKGCDILMRSLECPAEVIIGYYYLRGTIYERMNQAFNAFRAYRVSLHVLETVYGM